MTKYHHKQILFIALLGLVIALLSLTRCTVAPVQPETAVKAPEPDKVKTFTLGQIDSVVSSSACLKVSFKDRGRMPIGFAKGVAHLYARDICKWRSPAKTVAGIIGGPGGSRDALSIYKQKPAQGEDRIRSMYALAFGFGMRESSGKYCEGIDRNLNTEHDTTEAGAFQASYNSRNLGKDVDLAPRLAALWDEYKAHPELCELPVWQEGVDQNAKSCRSKVTGTMIGHDWQRFVRSCPAFGAEWALAVARLRADHYGPVYRHEAEYRGECEQMLRQVDQVIECK